MTHDNFRGIAITPILCKVKSRPTARLKNFSLYLHPESISLAFKRSGLHSCHICLSQNNWSFCSIREYDKYVCTWPMRKQRMKVSRSILPILPPKIGCYHGNVPWAIGKIEGRINNLRLNNYHLVKIWRKSVQYILRLQGEKFDH